MKYTTIKGKKQAFLGSKRELSTLLGVHERTVSKMLAAGAPPKGPHGYPVKAWRSWHSVRLGNRAAGPREPAARAQERVRTARADLLDLRVQRERGEVIPVTEANKRLVELLKWMVGVMESAGGALAVQTAGEDLPSVKRIVKAYFDEKRLQALGKMKEAREVRQAERRARSM